MKIYKRTRDDNRTDLIIIKKDTVAIIIANKNFIGGMKNDTCVELFPLSFARYRINKIEYNYKDEAKLVVENVFRKSLQEEDTTFVLYEGYTDFYDEKKGLRFSQFMKKDLLKKNRGVFSFPLYFTNMEGFDAWRIGEKGEGNKVTLPDTIYYDYMKINFGEVPVPMKDIMIKPHETVYVNLYFNLAGMSLIDSQQKLPYHIDGKILTISYPYVFFHLLASGWKWPRDIFKRHPELEDVTLSEVELSELSDKENEAMEFIFFMIREESMKY